MTKTTAINADGAPDPVGGYSQAMLLERFERLLFISGQIPETVDGETPEDFSAQCRLVWSNVLAQLDAAGMSVANLVKVTAFLSSRRYADANGRIRAEFLGSHRPALTVIVTGIYDDRWLVEIEAIAAE